MRHISRTKRTCIIMTGSGILLHLQMFRLIRSEAPAMSWMRLKPPSGPLITTDSFESALLKAVNLGDDTDTVGAIAGGLAGLYYGYDAIPEDWLSAIKRREWIEDLCQIKR